MAIESLNLLGSNLREVVISPNNIEARGAMLIGSCMAGISFLKGLGLVHAISHMVGAVYNSQHGRTNAILLPLILSIPFYFSIYNLSFLNALFETVSGFTSTGFTIFDEINYMDQGLILWRSSIQWIGGLYFLFSIIFLIDIYDESLKKSLTNFLSFNSSEILKQTIKIFLLYSSLTVAIFIILNITGIRSFNSLNLAMTIISSGGFLPTNELSSILVKNTQIIVFSFLNN